MGYYANLSKQSDYDDEGRAYGDESRYAPESYVPEYDEVHASQPEEYAPPQPDEPAPQPQNVGQPANQSQVGIPTTGGMTINNDDDLRLNTLYTPSWFIEEANNLKNPDYVPTYDMDPEAVKGIGNYASKLKEQNPDQWKYGDPGWSADNEVWEYIRPYEQSRLQKQREEQIIQLQQERNQGTNVDEAIELTKNDPKFSKLFSTNQKGDVNNLTTSEKVFYYGAPAASGTEIENQSKLAQYTQPFIGSYMSSGGPAKLVRKAAVALAVPTAVGKALYAGAQAGLFTYSYGKQQKWWQGNKVVDKILEWNDLPDEKIQQLQGALDYAFEKTGGGDFTDWSKAGENWEHIVNNWDDFWYYAFGSGKASTEYPPEVVGAVTALSANIGADPFTGGGFVSRQVTNLFKTLLDENPEYVGKGQVTKANQGLSGVYDLPEELTGSNATMTMLELGKDLYDRGITDENDIKYAIGVLVGQMFGDQGNLAEYFEHELTDPSNVAENMEARETYALAKLTKDENLKIASQGAMGTLAGDLTGNIPVLPDIIRGIAKAAGKPDVLKTSSGINEILSQWDIENKKNPVDQLTGRDRRFSGISEDNTSSEFNPNPHKATTDIGKVVEKIVNLKNETGESKASREGDAIFEFVAAGVEDALTQRQDDTPETRIKRVKQFVNQLENPNTITSDSPYYNATQSVLFNDIKDDIAQGVKARRAEINSLIQHYEATYNGRQTLNTLATVLNLPQQEVLRMYENELPVLTQMIVDKADQNGGKIPGIDMNVEDSRFGKQVLGQLAPFVGKDSQAWNEQMLMVQLTTSVADGVSDALITKFNIQPDNLLVRFGDTIKKMQHLLLLGLSPSYLANNFINNVATRTALGYGGYMNPGTISSWMDRFGYIPQRLTDTMATERGGSTVEADSGHDILGKKIRDVKKAKGSGFRKDLAKFMDKAADAGKWASEKFGVFGNLSEKVEAMESKQITVAAMMNYMARTWKEGVNFRKMPAALEAEIERQNPGMSQAIYAAVRGGMNMTEIENAIYGTFIAPNVMDSLMQSAKVLGVDKADDFIYEYFVKNGMKDELEKALRGKRGGEIDRIMADFTKHLKDTLKQQMSSDLATRKEAIQNDVTNSGYKAAIQAGLDMSAMMGDMWYNSNNENTKVFEQRIKDNLNPAEFREIYQNHQRNLTERWKNVYATELQTFSGVLNGLGMGDQNRATYIDNLQKQREAWVGFYEKTQPELYQKYIDATAVREGDTFSKYKNGKLVKKGTWDARVEKAWKTYIEDADKAIAEVRKVEADAQKKMDAAFIAGMKEAVGNIRESEIDKNVVPKLEEIRNIRQAIIDQTNAMRATSNNTNVLNEKNMVWKEGNAERDKLIGDYYRLQAELYGILSTYDPFTATNPPVPNVTEEVDKIALLRAEITDDKATHDQKIYEKAAEQYADDALDDYHFYRDLPDNISVENLLGLQFETEEAIRNNFTRIQELNNEQWLENQEEISNLNEEQAMLNRRLQIIKDRIALIDSISHDIGSNEFIEPDTWESDLQWKSRIAKENLRIDIIEFLDTNFPTLSDDQIRNTALYISHELGLSTDTELDPEVQKQLLNYFTTDEKEAITKFIDDHENTARYIDNELYDNEQTEPQGQTFVKTTEPFEYGEYTCDKIVYHNNLIVAYVPFDFTDTNFTVDGREYTILGVSSEDPDLYVYTDGNTVKTQKRREDPGTNPYSGELEHNTLPMPDPVPQAHNEMAYEKVFDILENFVTLYKRNLDYNMTSQNWKNLDDDTRSKIRSYIDEVVRPDLMNTKYKASKFGETMRDAALLNYNKRYGFDNFLTLLFPYQFWNTRSFVNWFMRSGTKGGKLWRKYAKLKELEQRNRKEFMPSKISGLFGIPVNGLPSWMGGGFFMPTDQFLIVSQFAEPIIDFISGRHNNAVIAAAERYLQEDYENQKISWEQYLAATNPETRENNGYWQQAIAKAKETESDDNSFANLFNQYFGLALPLSIMKAVAKGDNTEWSQFPITRTGNALRATIGNNWIGKGAQWALSAPEKALRKAVTKMTGDDSFAYNEFGAFADYYIRNMLYDMVVEGKIGPDDALKASIEKDKNKYWSEAADRVRQEMLVKMQGGAVIDAAKKLVKGDGNTLDNFYYLLAAIATAPVFKQIVHEAEPVWRERKEIVSDSFANNDAETRNKLYEEHPEHKFNSERWEGDDEQRLRKHLYNSITNAYYNLSDSEQGRIQASFGPEFSQNVLNKDTRAIESMDIDTLAAYAQALNGSIPYLATDKLNTMNTPKINLMPIPETVMSAYDVYREERDKLYPGMSKVNQIYYSLPPEQRKIFADANPDLVKYQKWDNDYKKAHSEVKEFTTIQSDYYDMKEAEEVFSMMDKLTLKAITTAAYSGKEVDKNYQKLIEQYMVKSGSTKKYKDFVKNLTDYILGVQ